MYRFYRVKIVSKDLQRNRKLRIKRESVSTNQFGGCLQNNYDQLDSEHFYQRAQIGA